MADDSLRRLNRLAARAKALDDVIKKAAAMNKKIVEEIRCLGNNDKPIRQRMTNTPKPKRKRR